jgi:hypothetical protein
MRSSTRALSLLALGLGLGGLGGPAIAAPTTPPPPRTPSTTPPPPPASTGTPTPTGSRDPASSPPPPAGAGTSPTPPPPTAVPAGSPSDASPAAREPEPPPQDLSHTWGYSRSQPLQPRYVKTGDDPSYAAPNPVGFYSGVSVEGNHVPPYPAKQVGAPPVVMTWTGFERAPEGSRVFFQLSAEAAHEVTTKGLVLEVRMRNTKVNVRNNLRYLDLRYFDTAVRTVKVSRRGRDTVATLVLARDAVPTVQIIDGKAGYKLLVVQFSDAGPAEAAPR